MTAARLALWLFVVILGIAFGAGLYEHRIAMPRWIARDDGVLRWDAASARHDDTGLRFWAYVTTGPLTILTIANLFFAWSAVHLLLLHPDDGPVDGRCGFTGSVRHRAALGPPQLPSPPARPWRLARSPQNVDDRVM